MLIAYYYSLFAISMLLSMFYSVKWYGHYDAHVSSTFIMLPLGVWGYLLFSLAKTPEAAMLANKIQYATGSFLPAFVMFLLLDLCKIEKKKRLATVIFSAAALVFALALSIGHSPIFYDQYEIYFKNGVTYANKTYGWGHTVFGIYVVAYLMIDLMLVVISVKKKKDISRSNLITLMIFSLLVMLSYIARKAVNDVVELIPLAYVLGQFFLLVMMGRISLYHIDNLIVENMKSNEKIGYFALDLRRHYIGSRGVAAKVFPELAKVYVDDKIPQDTEFGQAVADWISEVDEYKGRREFKWSVSQNDSKSQEETFYKIYANYIYERNMIRGYQFFIEDESEDMRYINLINSYRSSLEKDVAEKTRYLQDIHDTLIMSLANMIENRDLSTGGHVKRTSEVVRILVKYMQDDEAFGMNPLFCRNVVKAAPMHDLGKIAVEDRILKKEGVFTDEEFAEMKKHSEKGAQIVRQILSGVKDTYFMGIAENVAHYHHERYDGSGYPEGLRGDDIPLEARIMAIADVYDALVSERCYKVSLSFEEAYGIIQEGFGKQFDPKLEKYFNYARAQLEEYYRTEDSR